MFLPKEDTACSYIATNDTVPSVYFVQAILFSIDLPLTIFGVILCITFICRKKTNFVERIFTYLSIAITPLVGLCWILSIPALFPIQLKQFCLHVADFDIVATGSSSILLIITILSISAGIRLLWKLSIYTCNCCARWQPWHNRTSSQQALAEVVFVILIFTLPTISGVLCLMLPPKDEETDSRAATVISKFLVYVFPELSFISFFGAIILLAWLYCCRSHITTGAVLMLRELLLYFIHLMFTLLLSVYCGLLALGLFVGYPGPGVTIGVMVVITLLSFYPLIVCAYMWYSLYAAHARSDVEDDDNRVETAQYSPLPTTNESIEGFNFSTTTYSSEVSQLIN